MQSDRFAPDWWCWKMSRAFFTPSLIATWSPARGVWETTQAQLCGHWAPYCLIWPAAGSMRNGVCFRRPPLALPTAATGSSSLLPTPDAYEAQRGGSQHPDKRRAGKHTPYLAAVIEHL